MNPHGAQQYHPAEDSVAAVKSCKAAIKADLENEQHFFRFAHDDDSQEKEPRKFSFGPATKQERFGPDQAEGQPESDPLSKLEAFIVKETYISRLGKEEFVFPNLYVRAHVVTIIALPGGAKTTFNYYFVAPFLAEKKFTVLYIDLDSPASDHKRMFETADRYGFRLLNPDANQGASVEGIVKTLREIADSQADLTDWVIFIDTLKKVADLMSKGSVKDFYKLARKLANLGATVVLLGHANKYRDKSGNLVFEGVGDVRADSDELIFFERLSNPNGGIDVTTVIDPDKGAKVRGIFEPISFHVSRDRQVSMYETPLSTVDFTATAAPKATDEEIVKAATKYLFTVGVPVLQTQVVQHVSDMTNAGKERVRRLLVQHAESKDSLTKTGMPIVYSLGNKNAHLLELSNQFRGESSFSG